MYTSQHAWKCPKCQLARFPDEETVKDGKKTFLIRKCRVCNYQDIEEIKPSRWPHLK